MSRLSPEFVLTAQDYISPSINLLLLNIQRLYSNLVDVLNQGIYSVFVAKPLEWKYELDTETGLEILKAGKHPKSLDIVQELADEIFK